MPPANPETISAARIAAILRRLSWLAPAAMLATAMLVALSFYLLQARPLAQSNAQSRQQDAAERVSGRVLAIVGQVESVLSMLQMWSRDGQATLDNVESFNRLLMPVVQQTPMVSSVHLANDAGREILLLKTPEGWKNRITQVADKGRQQHWLTWKDATTKLADEWKEQDYDPRRRPWFAGAMGAPEFQVHWTAPYIFQTTQDPGITLSVRWSDARGQNWVAAFDLMLTDLSRFTTQLSYGAHGQVALLTAEGDLLGLPRNAGFDTLEAVKKAVLQKPDKVGLGMYGLALTEFANGNPQVLLPGAVTPDGERWVATVKPVSLRNQEFRIVTLAPESDFSPWSVRLTVVLFGLIAGVIVLGVWMARRMDHRVTQPLHQVFLDLERSNREIAAQVMRASTVARLAPQLQAVQDHQELSRVLLSGLAESLHLGQGSLYRTRRKDGSLTLCGSFAADPDLAPRIAPGEGLLGQCAQEGRAIQLDQAAAGYLRVKSGLSEASVQTLLLLPIFNHNQLMGVVELATFTPMDDDKRALIENLLPMVGLCMQILAKHDE